MRTFQNLFSQVKSGYLTALQIIFPLALLFLLSQGYCHAADITVTATLNRASMSVEETAEMVVTVNGSGSAELDMAEVDGLEFTQRGHSRQLQFINGTASASLSMTYLIQATKPGTYVIPAVTVEVEGKKLQTEAIPFEVTSSSPQQQEVTPSPSSPDLPGEKDGQKAFLRAEVQNQSYVGERVPLQIKAYFPQNVQASVNTLPGLLGSGFVMEQLDSRPRQTTERLNGTTYNVLSWNTHLTGIKEGQFPFQLQLDAALLVRQKTRSPFTSQDPFADDFFANFLGGFERKPIKINTPETTLEILPLPTENQPKDFSGAIGDFTLQVKAAPTSIEIGQPLSITMIVEGTGNFDRVEAPIFPDQAGWKSYSPSGQYTPVEGNWKGKKIFEQAVVIKDKAISHIPQLSFSYFNPQKKQYVTRFSAPIPLEIKDAIDQSPAPQPTAAGGSSEKNSKTDSLKAEESKKTDLAPLHPEIGKLSRTFAPLFVHPWFQAFVICGSLFLLLLLGLLIRNRRLNLHPAEITKKQGRQLLAQASKELELAIAAGDSSAFLACCRSIIQQQLGLYWQVSPETITLADLTARIGKESALVEIFAAAEKGAYAGYGLSADTMRQFADRLNKECGQLP